MWKIQYLQGKPFDQTNAPISPPDPMDWLLSIAHWLFYVFMLVKTISKSKTTHIYDLVGGIPTPLKNMKVSCDDDIPNIWKNNKCSKSPISDVIVLCGLKLFPCCLPGSSKNVVQPFQTIQHGFVISFSLFQVIAFVSTGFWPSRGPIPRSFPGISWKTGYHSCWGRWPSFTRE